MKKPINGTIWCEFMTVKIYLSYHKNCDRIRTDILTPIHVGRSIARDEIRETLSDLIGDDTGDNISDMNPLYCELTAQYWVWKNTSDDYVGFLHYRRHFIFNDECKDLENKWGVVEYPYVSPNYLRHVGLDDESIHASIQGYDIVTMTPWNVTAAGSADNYDHYKSSSPYLHIEDYDEMIKIMLERYPDYRQDVDEYNCSKFGYYTNMFVMRRDLFDDYCEFLFGILFELSERIDISSYSEQEKRIYGYLSEWMFGIYITHLKRVSDCKMKELHRTFIAHPDIDLSSVNYCSSCDDNYARHLGVLLTSVKANKGSESINYWILSNGISDKNRKKIQQIESDDFKIRIIEHPHIDDPKLKLTLKTNPHLSLATYNKLFIVDYVPVSISRLLYLDTDMICRSSLHDLYHSEFDNSWVCGVKDVLQEENCKRLNLTTYINAGMLVIDCNAWRDNNVFKSFSEYISKNVMNPKAIFYHDQDVLNAVLKGKIRYIDPLWNAQTSSYKGCEEQNEIGKNANIIHFISERKPWLEGNMNPFEDEYFHYLEMSPWTGSGRYVGTVKKIKKKSLIQRGFSHVVRHSFGNKPSGFVKWLMSLDIHMGNTHDLNLFFDHYYLLNEDCARFAFSFVLPFAESGNPHAMVRVARAYKDGHGVDRDLKSSFEWFVKTRDSGGEWVWDEFADNIPAMYDDSYSHNDLEYNKSLFEALLPFAESGNPHAMVRVARAYKDGHGVDRDLKSSFEWFVKTRGSGVKFNENEIDGIIDNQVT
ncbi:DUF4422 domain-containing protein [Methanomethylophilus alvi]|uniref:DUF4422 domain-containing protein n=1 Tax=Methanomethylophilus alvi TaxID=1291540 RepID=UPI0037DC99AA